MRDSEEIPNEVAQKEGVAESAPPNEPERRPLWKTVLLVASSALLGGTAVAIWNRRTISRIRQESPAWDLRDRQPPPAKSEWDELS